MNMKQFFTSTLLLFSLLALPVFFCAPAAIGQTENTDTERKLMRIVMKDGSERIGYILSDDGREILLETKSIGNVYLNKSEIASIEEIPEDKVDKFINEKPGKDAFTTRYYFTTNAIPLEKGEHYGMINLYGPEVHYTPADNLSVGIMTSWIASPFVLALKYTIPTQNEKVNFGLGTLFGTSGYLNMFQGFGGLHWGMITFGDKDKNLTISGGISYLQAGLSDRIYEIPGTYYPSNPTDPNPYINIPYETRTPNPLIAPVISVGAYIKATEKATFIIDGMLFFASRKDQRTVRESVYGGVDEWGNNVDLISTTVSLEDYRGTLLYLMPGMRFQSTARRAFQISMAGVSYFENDRLQFTFPVPMCSWFFKI
jgi:hypothetical protein